ncbi:MAG: hypothetical protein ABDH49_06825 [Candidatus Hydrothermales bacterium]
MAEELKIKELKNKKSEEVRHIYAAFSYIPFLNFVPLLDSKAGEFVHFHAKQGFLIFIIEFIGLILFFSFHLLVGSIPIIRYIFINFFFAFYILGVGLLVVLGLYGALTGKMLEIPFVGEFAKKLNI